MYRNDKLVSKSIERNDTDFMREEGVLFIRLGVLYQIILRGILIEISNACFRTK